MTLSGVATEAVPRPSKGSLTPFLRTTWDVSGADVIISALRNRCTVVSPLRGRERRGHDLNTAIESGIEMGALFRAVKGDKNSLVNQQKKQRNNNQQREIVT
eukprot:TRINITY_DN1004_c0_g1_i5.p1 TRINITY_DN1004_c0_g1~~TRINITY_DN1004_c0_g1_i5.p1  ORF type:complete len:102 (-),score=7.52 TRINITY_DN1004_c0_g1_i5:4-309(-)